MIQRRMFGIAMIVAAALGFGFQNCGAPAVNGKLQSSNLPITPTPTPGPLEARYVLGGWVCGSIDLMGPAQSVYGIRSVLFELIPGQVRQVTTFFSNCSAVQYYSRSNPTPSTLSLGLGASECNLCSLSQCQPKGAPNPPISYLYSQAKAPLTLTLSRALTSIETNDVTSVYKQAGCTPGLLETLTYVLQP